MTVRRESAAYTMAATKKPTNHAPVKIVSKIGATADSKPTECKNPGRLGAMAQASAINAL